MKKFLPVLVLLLAFGCTKEKVSPTVSGKWTIVESAIGTGGGLIIQTYSPSSELTIEFGVNNTLSLTGSNPGTANSPLWPYDKYETLSADKIRFYQSAGSGEMEAYVTLNGELRLDYAFGCGHGERFARVK